MTDRPHPFEFAFRPLADDAFPAILEQGGATPALPVFTGLLAVRKLLAILVPDAADREVPEYAGMMQLAYLAFRFWAADEPTADISRAAFEDTERRRPAVAGIPAGAAYYRLPPQWFWARIDESAPHEPIDGIFMADSGEEWIVTAVLGFRPERYGFSQLMARADRIALAAAPGALRQPPFGPVMEGGEAAGFRSILTEAELLYLAHLAHHSAER